MSTFLESPPDWVIGTSTALIVSSDFRNTLLAPHKIGKLMPLGGKVEVQRDRNLFDLALQHELREEGGIELSELMPRDWSWHPIFWVSPVRQFRYHLKWKNALDTLYLFVVKKTKQILWNEKKCQWHDIKKVCSDSSFWLSPHRFYLRSLLRSWM
jgi:hypothetical protein